MSGFFKEQAQKSRAELVRLQIKVREYLAALDLDDTPETNVGEILAGLCIELADMVGYEPPKPPPAETPKDHDPADDYDGWTMGQLRKERKARGLPGDIRHSKADIVAMLRENDKGGNAE
jgi:hypothetical protein